MRSFICICVQYVCVCVCVCVCVRVCVCMHKGIPVEVCVEPLELRVMNSPLPRQNVGPHLLVEEPTWPWGAKESSLATEASFARGWGGEDRRVTG